MAGNWDECIRQRVESNMEDRAKGVKMEFTGEGKEVDA
jgi:hypothetical protein